MRGRQRKGRSQEKKEPETQAGGKGCGQARSVWATICSADVPADPDQAASRGLWMCSKHRAATAVYIFIVKSSHTCSATGASAGRGSLFCTSPTRTVRGPLSCSSAASKAYPCSSKSPSEANSKALLGRPSFLNGQGRRGETICMRSAELKIPNPRVKRQVGRRSCVLARRQTERSNARAHE